MTSVFWDICKTPKTDGNTNVTSGHDNVMIYVVLCYYSKLTTKDGRGGLSSVKFYDFEKVRKEKDTNKSRPK